MEEFLVLFIQVLIEVLVNSTVSLPFDIFFNGKSSKPWSNGCWLTILFAICGAALGGLSIFLLPHAMITHSELRVMNFFVAPLLAGFFALLLARYRGDRKHEWMHFGNSLLFTLIFVGIRLAFCNKH